jgi:thiol-disulfide isomerase/thioredoxin
MKKLKSAWQGLRKHYWASLAFDVFLIIAAFSLVSMWQTRNLPDDEHTPALQAVWLDDMKADEVMVSGEVGIIYFFAPWCFYCRNSIDNLNNLVANGDLPWARIVALEYSDLDEVRDFIKETGVNLPVLLGSQKTTQDWQIRAFPTYFVIDKNGQIASRSVGYSTSIGLQTRVWMHKDK